MPPCAPASSPSADDRVPDRPSWPRACATPTSWSSSRSSTCATTRSSWTSSSWTSSSSPPLTLPSRGWAGLFHVESRDDYRVVGQAYPRGLAGATLASFGRQLARCFHDIGAASEQVVDQARAGCLREAV